MRLALLILAVLAHGQGIPGVTVNAGGLTTLTDAQGYYSLTVPAPFSGTISAYRSGYTFAPVSLNLANVTTSRTFDFVATPLLPQIDTTPPTIAITSPAAIAAGPVVLTCAASDNVGVVRVEWAWDTAAIGTAYAAPWSLAWTVTAKGKGKHALTATAVDAAGNRATASLSVRMQ